MRTLAVDPGTHLFWLGSRSLGIVAMLLSSLSVGLGLAMSTRIGRKPGANARFKVVHEALALVSLVAIAGHGLLLLGDPFLHPTVAQITVPFLLDRDPLWTGVGIITGWLALAFTLSFYLRKRIGTRRWRQLHRWTILVFVFGVAHTLGTGTDAGAPWFLAMLTLAAAPVMALGAVRLGNSRPPDRFESRTYAR